MLFQDIIQKPSPVPQKKLFKTQQINILYVYVNNLTPWAPVGAKKSTDIMDKIFLLCLKDFTNID